jgi:hypothetical protein
VARDEAPPAAKAAPPAAAKGSKNAAAAALAGLRKPKPGGGQSFADFFATRPRADDPKPGAP